MAGENKPTLRARLNQLLDAEPNMAADQAVERLKGEGLGDANRIRSNFHNTKSERKRAAAGKAPAAAPAKPKPPKAKGRKAGGGKPAPAKASGTKAAAATPGPAVPASDAVRQLEGVIRRCGGITAVRQLLDVLERIGTR
jgi:hypothetical protein